MSAAICLAPARTIIYPKGGGHLWVYLQWALGLRALGYRVIWLEGIDPRDPKRRDPRELVTTLQRHLEPYGLAESLALFSLNDEPLPPDVAERTLDLAEAAEADLLLNLWHSLPAPVVRRFRRSASVDTDPGLLQIWMTTGDVTPAPVFLPAWPVTPAHPGAPYTTLTHWWGGTFDYRGVTFSNEKRAAFLEFANLSRATSAQLELGDLFGTPL